MTTMSSTIEKGEATMPEQLPGEGWMARPFGRDMLHTQRLENVPFEQIVPNPDQPREGRWESDELKREIEDAGGVFEPLLVEPHPELEGKYLIIDGHRRWTNVARILNELDERRDTYPSDADWRAEYDKYNLLNLEVTHKTLSTPERLRVWIYIHRQRKEWSLHEKERTAHKLVEAVGTTAAAGILGISTKALGKLVETFGFAKSLEPVLADPEAAISWAREIASLSPKYREPHVLDVLRNKISARQMVNSKEVRALRQIVPNEKALEKWLEDGVGIDEALELVPDGRDPIRPGRRSGSTSGSSYGHGLASDVRTFNETLANYPWTELSDARKDPALRDAVLSAERHLKQLKKALEE